MNCPFCDSDTSVEMSRPSTAKPSVWRRRQCESCNRVFSTREKPDLSLSVTVKKDDAQEEPFSEDKLLLSVYKCLTHRNDAIEASRKLSETIASRLLESTNTSLNTKDISRVTYQILARFDSVSAVFYKSHHKIN